MYDCNALGRYIFNNRITGISVCTPIFKVISFDHKGGFTGSVLNTMEHDTWDSKCDFKPNADYNISDYYELLDEGMGCLR